MAKAKKNTKTKLREVKFSFESIDATEIFVLGDFNKWDPTADPLINDGSGKWNRVVQVLPGKYDYKFLVDGQWMVDPCNDQRTLNCFGTENSVLELK